MDWWDIVKLVRTNEYSDAQHLDEKAFVVNDAIWLEAGGRPWKNDDAEGWKYMDIEDIEESIGRKLTYDDFRIHYRNGLAPNPVLIDRLGGPQKQDQILREAMYDLLDAAMFRQVPPDPFIEFLDRKPNHPLAPTIMGLLKSRYDFGETTVEEIIEEQTKNRLASESERGE